MPDLHRTIGEAVASAMQHNINLANSGRASAAVRSEMLRQAIRDLENAKAGRDRALGGLTSLRDRVESDEARRAVDEAIRMWPPLSWSPGRRPEMPPRPICDTCGVRCQGGANLYRDARGHLRTGCADQQACAAAWSVGRPEPRRPLPRLPVVRVQFPAASEEKPENRDA